MNPRFWYCTPAGTFRIESTPTGWQARLGDDILTPPIYLSPQHVLDDLAGGQTDCPVGVEMSLLALPDTLDDWHAS